MMALMLILWVAWMVLLVIGFMAHYRVAHDMGDCSGVKVENGLNGCVVAEKMLRDNQIHNVRVKESTRGLADNYSPMSRTVNLSRGVYRGKGVEHVAVAIHECGYVLQYDKGHVGVIMRSMIVPIVMVLTKIVPWVLIVGLLLSVVYFIVAMTGGSLFGLEAGQLYNGAFWVLLVSMLLYGLTLLLAMMMLPIENKVSKVAMAWVKTCNVISAEDDLCVEKVFRSVARSYLLRVLTSLTDSLSKVWDGITWVWFWIT